MAEQEKIKRFADRRMAFMRQIDNAFLRGRLDIDEALYDEIVRLAVEEYGVNADVLPKGSRGEVLEAIIENLSARSAPTLH